MRVIYYSTHMSYEKVSEMCEVFDGTPLLSDQRIYQIVGEQAAMIKSLQQDLLKSTKDQAIPEIDYKVDIYNPDSKEIQIFEDGIGVRKQKVERDKVPKNKREWYYTNVIVMQKKQGDYQQIVAAEDLDLTQIFKANLIKEYGETKQSLPVVIFSDGATNIRRRMKKVLGKKVVRILDWYHLKKKVWQLMSMIATNKQIKEEKAKEIMTLLWKGQTKTVIGILKKMKVKNHKKRKELIVYLKKHKKEIINYEKRVDSGKKIGSGRVEKAVDLIVGIRQKKKSHSWSKKGSNALALATNFFLNNDSKPHL